MCGTGPDPYWLLTLPYSPCVILQSWARLAPSIWPPTLDRQTDRCSFIDMEVCMHAVKFALNKIQMNIYSFTKYIYFSRIFCHEFNFIQQISQWMRHCMIKEPLKVWLYFKRLSKTNFNSVHNEVQCNGSQVIYRKQ